jgi:hypothetical protein
VSGKISGVVINKETGHPLVGATVKVEGARLVTQTDEDGEYFILNLPVGKYDVTVTSIGFRDNYSRTSQSTGGFDDAGEFHLKSHDCKSSGRSNRDRQAGNDSKGSDGVEGDFYIGQIETAAEYNHGTVGFD